MTIHENFHESVNESLDTGATTMCAWTNANEDSMYPAADWWAIEEHVHKNALREHLDSWGKDPSGNEWSVRMVRDGS